MKENEQTIESLAPRIKALAESLCATVSDDNVRELERRVDLER